jgi:hypothetical protein
VRWPADVLPRMGSGHLDGLVVALRGALQQPHDVLGLWPPQRPRPGESAWGVHALCLDGAVGFGALVVRQLAAPRQARSVTMFSTIDATLHTHSPWPPLSAGWCAVCSAQLDWVIHFLDALHIKESA